MQLGHPIAGTRCGRKLEALSRNLFAGLRDERNHYAQGLSELGCNRGIAKTDRMCRHRNRCERKERPAKRSDAKVPAARYDFAAKRIDMPHRDLFSCNNALAIGI